MKEEYHEGQGCTCLARSWVECGCEDADWTPKEVYTLRKRIVELEGCLEAWVNLAKQFKGGTDND
tara:strand:- start:90 stop:284 length:195 start_codon:yes stop_codon:yes gene_type:complete